MLRLTFVKIVPLCHTLTIQQYKWFINQEVDDIYFQYDILCLYHESISSFFSLSVLKLLKHVQLFVKCELHAGTKNTDDQREESITEDPQEEPITEGLNRTLSLTTLKRPYHWESYRGLHHCETQWDRSFIDVDPQKLQYFQSLLHGKKVFSDFW